MKKITLLTAAILAMTSCGNSDTEYDASGIFETTEIIVSAKGSGELVSFTANEGKLVDTNMALGCIDTTQLSLRRKALAATLSATDSRKLDVNRQVASLEQQIANLQTERKRFSELVRVKAATQKQLDDINYQIEVLERQLRAMREQIGSNNSSLSGQSASIAAQVAQIDDQLADCIITSPTRGIILSKYAEQGEYATPGKPLFKVGDIENMKLRAYVSAPQLTTLKIGQKVRVFADLGESDRKEYDGTVVWISDEAEFTPKTIQTRDERSNLVYGVKIAVKNDGTIKRGMYGEVSFSVKNQE